MGPYYLDCVKRSIGSLGDLRQVINISSIACIHRFDEYAFLLYVYAQESMLKFMFLLAIVNDLMED